MKFKKVVNFEQTNSFMQVKFIMESGVTVIRDLAGKSGATRALSRSDF
jgi:hypothetical protein